VSEVDLAAPERWLESKRRSRQRRFAAARAAARRRFKHRSTVAVVAVMALGAGGAAAQGGGATSTQTQSSTIAAVQQKLGITADGVAGPQTRRAVRAFQRRNGLTVDGIIGPETLGALGIRATPTTTTSTTSSASSALEAIAQCESGGDPTAVSSTGQYRGKYQFSRSTWRAMGGTGDPAATPEAVQDRLAAKLYAQQGSAPWPVCG
jgi:peptidoglycan hydrolase-like protein with peptidoglycan-binding domain